MQPKLTQLVGLWVGLTLVAVPAAVFALGQLTLPIEVKNARRGQVIRERLILNNADDRRLQVTLQAEGVIASWASFYLPGDLQTPTTSITIAARSNREAYVKLVVPLDARNGSYTGTVAVQQAAAASTQQSGAGAVVAQSVSRRVSITVTDQEDITFTAQVIPVVYDIKPGGPLAIKLLYRNQGNVEISPQANVVVTQDGKTVGETIFPYPKDLARVKPREEATITIQWPSYGLAEGKYRATVTTTEGKVEQQDTFAFSVTKAAGKVLGKTNGTPGGGLNSPWVAGGVIVAVVLIVGLGIAARNSRRIRD